MNSTRRQFIAAGLAAAPIAALAQGTPAATPPRQKTAAIPTSGGFAKTGRIQLGLVTYNLAKDWDIATILTNCSKTGFQGVELRTTHKHGVEVSLNATERAEVKRRFADSPVELYSLGSAFDYHTPDASRLRADIEATKQYLQLAHDVGASGIKVRPNGLPKEVPEEKTLEQIGRSLRELGETAAGLGQQVRLEVHGTATSSLPRIRRMMDVAHHRSVGVCWNSNQSDLEGAGFEPISTSSATGSSRSTSATCSSPSIPSDASSRASRRSAIPDTPSLKSPSPRIPSGSCITSAGCGSPTRA